jgi:hypothetical protein
MTDYITMLNDLRDNLKNLGLTDNDIDNRIFTKETLLEILNAVDQVGDIGWEYLRTFPEEKHFFCNNEPILNDISKIYYTMSTGGLHSGASFALMMRLVESIAKNGFKGFANIVINNVTSELQQNISKKTRVLTPKISTV